MMTIEEQIRTLIQIVENTETEKVALKEAHGRILAMDVLAAGDVPPFDRSPYDGYAFRSADVKKASLLTPVTLKVLEEIAAGDVPHYDITENTAVRIMTGAPIPNGADCVIKYEQTEFTETEVKIFEPMKSGDNIVYKGEDIKAGTALANRGMVIDPGLAGTLAGQNIAFPLVYKTPKVGIITTGSELVEVGEELKDGKIYDSNAYTISGVIRRHFCEPVMYGIVGDDIDTIAEKIDGALKDCDMVITTGGVSVGDFDYTPEAIKRAGARILFQKADLKPGMACAYGEKGGKIICGLSGNPMASVINFLVIALPALKKLAGIENYMHNYIDAKLMVSFKKPNKKPRALYGTLDLSDGIVKFEMDPKQGNVILSTMIGRNAIAVIPAGNTPLVKGTTIKAIMI